MVKHASYMQGIFSLESYTCPIPPMREGGTVVRFPYFEPSRKDKYDIALMEIFIVIVISSVYDTVVSVVVK